MALLEKEATRFAASLDDYEHVTFTDMGGLGALGFCSWPVNSSCKSCRWESIAFANDLVTADSHPPG